MIERQRPQSKVSIEDLIRLKRAERPAPEFWTEFENQLRRKQLAAIVDKRPWWRRRLSVASLAKFSLPVGASAVIAFALVSMRDRSAPATNVVSTAGGVSAQAQSVGGRDASSANPANTGAPVMLVNAQADEHVSETGSSARQRDSGTGSALVQASTTSAVSVNSGQEGLEPSLAQVILGLEGIESGDARRYYEADQAPALASLGVSENQLARSMPATLVDPLSQNASYQDGRRARLLASIDSSERGESTAGNSRVARSRERIANRLAEQSLYDSISRLGLSGDSVSIKF